MLQLQVITAGEFILVLILLFVVFLFMFCYYLIDKNAELLNVIYIQNKKIESDGIVLSDLNSLITQFNQSLMGKE